MVKNALTARFPPGPHGQLADRELQHWSKGSKEGEERGKGKGKGDDRIGEKEVRKG